MKYYVADFETITDPKDCRVWAYAVCAIGDVDNIVYGTCIEDFIDYCQELAPAKIYFHNLGFDGCFILDYLLKHDWHWTDDKNDKYRAIHTCINNFNQVYKIVLNFDNTLVINFIDSLKIIPLSVKDIATSFKLPILKGDLDYEAYREKGHVLTDEEKAYIKNDVQIVAIAMENWIAQGFDKITAGSNALADYKSVLGGHKRFRFIYPMIEQGIDEFLRKSYRGGFVYVNPKYQHKEIGEGIVLDFNSLYPSVMAATDGQILPYGEPVYFDGEYKFNRTYPLWVAEVTCSFEVKEEHIPCIQLKGNFRFRQNEYLTSSQGETTFVTTSIDWKLIEEQYNLYNVKWHGGYMFKANKYQFRKYVEKWTKVKIQSKLDKNMGMYQLAKLMLNSLYGKFGTRIEMTSREPVIVDDVVNYINCEPEIREPVYLPVALFVTAHARYKTITSAQKVYDRFIYADTDSLHLVGTEIPDCFDIDSTKLGYLDHELTFEKAKYLRQKCYIEKEKGKDNMIVHVAGLPKVCHSQVTFDNFHIEAVYQGKLYPHRVSGGVVLVPGQVEIRKS